MSGTLMGRVREALARRRAAWWFARLRRPGTGEAERRRHRRWLAGHAANRRAFARCESAWERLATIEHEPATGEMLGQARAAVHRDAGAARPAAPWHGGPLGWGAAAAACVVLVLGTVWLMPPSYSTTVGERREIMLEDGSVMFLNADTSLSVRYGEDSRTVRLRRGDAVFKVARDASRPFSVRVADGHVRALGTEFAVRYRREAVLVAVVEGRVGVSAPESEAGDPRARDVEVGAGKAVSYEKGGALSRVRAVNPARIAPWRHGKIYFDAARLEEAIAEYNLYSPVTITLGTRDLADELVSGAFNTDDLEGFLFALEKVLNVHAIRQRDHVILLRAARGRSAAGPSG